MTTKEIKKVNFVDEVAKGINAHFSRLTQGKTKEESLYIACKYLSYLAFKKSFKYKNSFVDSVDALKVAFYKEEYAQHYYTDLLHDGIEILFEVLAENNLDIYEVVDSIGKFVVGSPVFSKYYNKINYLLRQKMSTYTLKVKTKSEGEEVEELKTRILSLDTALSDSDQTHLDTLQATDKDIREVLREVDDFIAHLEHFKVLKGYTKKVRSNIKIIILALYRGKDDKSIYERVGISKGAWHSLYRVLQKEVYRFYHIY